MNLNAKLQYNGNEIFKPLFFRLVNTEDKVLFEEIIKNPNIQVFDNILPQIKELIKYKNPSVKFTDEQVENELQKYICNKNITEYGVWVFYPWSNRIVHILDREEFVALRTSRNQYKITPEEQTLLRSKKIGVIGLSVGQSVALTLAMERTCAELRLADFDDLELTNLNRIRTGIHNLGLLKVYITAREIAEIDPFIEVKCFPEGLNEENMNAFFLEGGKLDLLVEESDGFDIKILSRYKAKELQVPVIMESNDKCAVDVERFDLEPDREILHGKVRGLNIERLKQLKSTEDKIPYILNILGIETSSSRLKASLIEIGQTITSWPQLASSVTMGGGVTTDVIRRILLGGFNSSGRYYVDIENIISDENETGKLEYYKTDDLIKPQFHLADIEKLIKANVSVKTGDALSEEDLTQILEAAAVAPSAGNNQPWKFLYEDNILYLLHDQFATATWADKLYNITYISFGTLIENIILQAGKMNIRTSYSLFPFKENTEIVAALTFYNDKNIKQDYLSDYIYTRCTNRKKGDNSLVDKTILEKIKEHVVEIPGADFSYLQNATDIEALAKIVSITERIRFLNPNCHNDFFSKELKWPSNENEQILEGLDIRTLELKKSDETGIKVASDPVIIDLLIKWGKGKGFEKLSYDSIRTSSAIGLITMPIYSSENWITGGRAVERAWLAATHHNLAIQPISAPLFFNIQINNGGASDYNDKEKEELNYWYDKLKDLFPELNLRAGLFLFRIFQSSPPTIRSLRNNYKELYLKFA